MVTIWGVIVILSVIGSALTGIWFVYMRLTEIRRSISNLREENISSVFFGEESGIELVDDRDFEKLIKSHADEAKQTIDRISVHMYTIDKQEHEQYRDPDVHHRILLLKPTKKGETGKHTGYETGLISPYGDNDLLGEDSFKQPFSYINRSLTSGEWENVDVRVYETTPWIRGAIIDDRFAGIIFVPTIQGGRDAQKFWTDNSDTVGIFTDIFEDIWTDKRTTDFEPWYEQWEYSEITTSNS